MTELFINLRPVRDDDIPVLEKLAKDDGHAIIAPTYVVEKNHQMLGYIGTIPSVLLWLDSQRVKARDSMIVANTYEILLRANGAQIIGVPCVQKSPLRPYLSKIGYVDAGHTSFFLKNLNP